MKLHKNPSLMARLFIIALAVSAIVIVLSSCITEKKRAEICRTCAVKEITTVQDSSWQKKYDSLLKIPVKGPVIILKDNPCADLCDSLGRVKDFEKSVVSETGIKGTIKADSKTNTITIDCGKADSLDHLLKNARVENNRLIKTNKFIEVPARCDKEHRNWIDHLCRWLALVSVIYWVGRFLYRKYVRGL